MKLPLLSVLAFVGLLNPAQSAIIISSASRSVSAAVAARVMPQGGSDEKANPPNKTMSSATTGAFDQQLTNTATVTRGSATGSLTVSSNVHGGNGTFFNADILLDARTNPSFLGSDTYKYLQAAASFDAEIFFTVDTPALFQVSIASGTRSQYNLYSAAISLDRDGLGFFFANDLSQNQGCQLEPGHIYRFVVGSTVVNVSGNSISPISDTIHSTITASISVPEPNTGLIFWVGGAFAASFRQRRRGIYRLEE